jgi:hypothetical protein
MNKIVLQELATQLHTCLDEMRDGVLFAPKSTLIQVFDQRLLELCHGETLFAHTPALYDAEAVALHPIQLVLGMYVPPHRLSATDIELGLYVLSGESSADGRPEILAGIMFLPYGRQVIQVHTMFLDSEGVAPHVPHASLRYCLKKLQKIPLFGYLRRRIEAFPVGTNTVGSRNRLIKKRMLAEYDDIESK